jgi:hypothetical protein
MNLFFSFRSFVPRMFGWMVVGLLLAHRTGHSRLRYRVPQAFFTTTTDVE